MPSCGGYSVMYWISSWRFLGDTEVDGDEFARLLRLTLSQYAVATIPAALDQVKVSP